MMIRALVLSSWRKHSTIPAEAVKTRVMEHPLEQVTNLEDETERDGLFSKIQPSFMAAARRTGKETVEGGGSHEENRAKGTHRRRELKDGHDFGGGKILVYI